MKPFKNVRNLINHINKFHYVSEASETCNVQSNATSTKTSWTPNPLSFQTYMTELIADMRFSTNLTEADLGGCVDAPDKMLSKFMTEISGKIVDFFTHNNIDTCNEDTKAFLE